MEFGIRDNTGKNIGAKVDQEGRLHVFAIVEPEDKHVAREGRTWSAEFTTTPVGAGDYFFYLKNSGDIDLTITDIRVLCAAAETIDIDAVSGTPTYTAGADVSPINRNRGKEATVPEATIKSDTDTTGLSDDGTIFFIRCDTANKMEHLRTSSNIIIPRGTAIALKATTGTNQIRCIVSISVIDQESL